MKPVLMEYNSLFDPHLKSYFYRPGLTQKLVQNGFVTEDLDVLMPLRTYNVFRKFMENEFLKTHREKAEHFEVLPYIHALLIAGGLKVTDYTLKWAVILLSFSHYNIA